jgi:hypothetical protein
MKANKVTVKIKVEALSVDSIPGLLGAVEEQLKKEVTAGRLCMDDGDRVSWSIKTKGVQF